MQAWVDLDKMLKSETTVNSQKLRLLEAEKTIEGAVEEHESLLKTQENNDHSEQLVCETDESFLNDI
ncbi:hypothetical protein ILUMI_10292, partial [Ignelater luminosus]